MNLVNVAHLLSGAAVVWLLLRRPESSDALPPLSPSVPLPLPSDAPAMPPGPSALQFFRLVLPWAVVAALWLGGNTPFPSPGPAPAPAPVAGLDLRGKFVGESAAEDASTTAELLSALADCLEHDAAHGKRLTMGAQFAELRTLARDYRTSGVSIGQRQPLARDAIKAYLDSEVGTDGGPVDDVGRARWVTAFRGVAAAAREAIGR